VEWIQLVQDSDYWLVLTIAMVMSGFNERRVDELMLASYGEFSPVLLLYILIYVMNISQLHVL
jgi:hypothetical protein